MYEPPAFIREHEEELHHAHDGSFVYNNLNIRVDSWEEKENTFVTGTRPDEIFLLSPTDRAMDYRLKNGRTVRDELYDGPFPKDLSESELSNHLGFNGFLISSDGYVPLVKRRKDVSGGKRLLRRQRSGVSEDTLRAERRENAAETFGYPKRCSDGDPGRAENPVRQLKICGFYTLTAIWWRAESLSFSSARAARRRKMRCRRVSTRCTPEGKVTSTWTRQRIRADFFGFPFRIWKSEKLFVMPEGILYEGRRYPMVPSASAAVVMLIFWLRETKA